jgi:hypothetical protein
MCVCVCWSQVALGHCKIRFEENDVDEEVLDFYEFPDRDAAAGGEDEEEEEEETGEQSSAAPGGGKRQLANINAHGELVLSDGSVIGHRDLKRFYSQNQRPRETRESVLINRLMSSYKLLALPGYSPSGAITPQVKRAQKLARAKQGAYNEKVGTNSNLLIRKYFRVVCAGPTSSSAAANNRPVLCCDPVLLV